MTNYGTPQSWEGGPPLREILLLATYAVKAASKWSLRLTAERDPRFGSGGVYLAFVPPENPEFCGTSTNC